MADTKERTFTYRFLGSLILILLYIGVVSIPWYGDAAYKWIYDASLRVAVLIAVILIQFFDKSLYKPSVKIHPYLWPTLLLCFSNLFIYLVFPADRYQSGNISLLYQSGLITLLTVLCEETVFRYSLLPSLRMKFNKHLSILISAGIFAICHIFNLFSGMDIGATFAQIGYTFIIGLLCGFFAIIDDLPLAYIFHFLFNFLETDVYLALGGSEWNYKFFLINIAFGVVFVGYAFFWYAKKLIIKNNNDKDL